MSVSVHIQVKVHDMCVHMSGYVYLRSACQADYQNHLRWVSNPACFPYRTFKCYNWFLAYNDQKARIPLLSFSDMYTCGFQILDSSIEPQRHTVV